MLFNAGEIARRSGADIQLRPEPLRSRWELSNLPAADGNDIALSFTCSLRALPDPVERRMLSESLLSNRAAVYIDDLVELFRAPLRAAAENQIRQRDATSWLAEDAKNVLLDSLQNAAAAVAFASGLELLPPFDLHLHSPSLERQRAESTHRAQAEQRLAGQLQHLQHSATLLREFQALRQSSAHASAGQLLAHLSPNDQGATLAALTFASASETSTRALYAVAGTSLLQLNPQSPDAVPAIHELGDAIGPLRSIRVVPGGLLIGSRKGIMRRLHETSHAYLAPTLASPLGFSRVVHWNAQLWACHSDAGLFAWDLDHPQNPSSTIPPATLGGPPRHLQAIDDHLLLFSAGNNLTQIRRDSSGQLSPHPIAQSTSEIAAILPDRDRIFIALKDGTVEHRSAATFELIARRKLCSNLAAAALLPWLSESRLLLATADGPILCVGWDDQLITQFNSDFGPVISLAASPDLLAALTADRQRLLLWNPWDGTTPRATLHIPSLTRHRCADLAL